VGQSAPLERPTVAAVGIAAGAGVALGAALAGTNAARKRKAEKAETAGPKESSE
jgi:hypothetical protein